MAVKNIRVDDIDMASVATDTVPFTYRGTRYEIDVCDDNAKQFDDAMSKWIHAARVIAGQPKVNKVKKTNGNGHGKEYYAAVRSWARENGRNVHARGRIPNEVIAAYQAAS